MTDMKSYVILDTRASSSPATNDERIFIYGVRVTDTIDNKNSFRFTLPLQTSFTNDNAAKFFNMRRVDESLTVTGLIDTDCYYKYSGSWAKQTTTARQVAWKLREFIRSKTSVVLFWGNGATTVGTQDDSGFSIRGMLVKLSVDEVPQDSVQDNISGFYEPRYTVTFTFAEGAPMG